MDSDLEYVDLVFTVEESRLVLCETENPQGRSIRVEDLGAAWVQKPGEEGVVRLRLRRMPR